MPQIKERLHWFAMHGVVRAVSRWSARRGDPQARLLADPAVRADPVPFYDELRAQGPLIRGSGELSDRRPRHRPRAAALRRLPGDRAGLESARTAALAGAHAPATDLLHPLRPPSLLAVEPPDHTRYRKTVSSVFTSRAVSALRDGVEDTADGAARRTVRAGPGWSTSSASYCSQLPVAVISDILGVPDADRPRVLEFGELAAPSLDLGLSWPQYQRVQRRARRVQLVARRPSAALREHPGEDLMSQLIQASDDGAQLDETELQAIAGLVLAAGFETTVNLLGNGIRLLLNSPDQLAKLAADPSLWPNAVEEILRLESPVQLSARVARTDTEVAGTTVRAGETGRDLPGRRQPRSRGVRRSAPLRRGAGQCR